MKLFLFGYFDSILGSYRSCTYTASKILLNEKTIAAPFKYYFFFYLFVKFEFLHVQEFKKIVINGLLIEIYPLNHSTYYLPITPPKRSLKISYLL